MHFLSVSVYKNIEIGYFHPTKQIGSAHTCKHNTVLDFKIPDFPRVKSRCNFSTVLLTLSYDNL